MDLSIFETGNGGDLQFTNNDLVTTSAIFNSVYLGLFGGSEWFGNNLFFPNEENPRFNSNFENVLRRTALTGSGLAALERAAVTSLSFLEAVGIVEVSATVQELDKLVLNITVTQRSSDIPQNIQIIWSSTRNEIIESRLI